MAKRRLNLGVSNDRSIGWGIAKALHAEGATLAFSYAMPMEKRIKPLAEELGVDFCEPCDVGSDEELRRGLPQGPRAHWDYRHPRAFDRLRGPRRPPGPVRRYLAGGLPACPQHLGVLVRRAGEPRPPPHAERRQHADAHYGSQKVAPKYNVMGVAKAALEATTRYLAWDLGGDRIRVNAISTTRSARWLRAAFPASATT